MLSQNIRNACNNKGITILQLEDQAGYVHGTINRWGDSNKKQSMPSADKLLNVAQILGTTVEELLKE